jgi:hypothetical protein
VAARQDHASGELFVSAALQKRKKTAGSSPTSKSAFGLLSVVPAELHEGPATEIRPLAILSPVASDFDVSDPSQVPIAIAMIRELLSQSPC